MDFIAKNKLTRRLRWRFDFAGKPSRMGFWSRPGDGGAAEGNAWSVNKDGLVRACIEAEDCETYKTYTAVECDGHDFINFEWVAGTLAPMVATGRVKLRAQVVGMRLHTRDKVGTVMMWDAPLHVRGRTLQENQVHLAGFGR